MEVRRLNVFDYVFTRKLFVQDGTEAIAWGRPIRMGEKIGRREGRR